MSVSDFPLHLEVDGLSKLPLHRQLYGGLRDAILEGRLLAGARLPASRVLAGELGLSRTTVLSAVEQLVAEGFLETRRGSGTFVTDNLPEEIHAGTGPTGPVSRRVSAPVISRRGVGLAAVNRPSLNSIRPFAPGMPALDMFPFRLWSRLLASAWRSPERSLPAVGQSGGYPPLRRAIAEYLRSARGLRCGPDQIVVVGGAQSAIHLAGQVLLDPGDRVLIEEPGYAGIRGALMAAGADVVPTRVDEHGLMIDDVRDNDASVRMACVAPSYQHPLGVVMSLARRLDLLDWARRSNAWILEDDYFSEYRYRGRPLAALQGLDEDGRVVYVGSFSKVLFPTLRLGYLVVPEAAVDAFLGARRVLDDHTSLLAQPALTRFIAEGHFTAHIRRMRKLYAARQRSLLASAERHLEGLLELNADETGMQLNARLLPALARRMTDAEAAQCAARNDVTVLPLSQFYMGRPEHQGLMMGYAGFSADEIELAAIRLRSALLEQTS
jgi:GntR family transcriptional regulator/MocR family aminotransferase